MPTSSEKTATTPVFPSMLIAHTDAVVYNSQWLLLLVLFGGLDLFLLTVVPAASTCSKDADWILEKMRRG